MSKGNIRSNRSNPDLPQHNQGVLEEFIEKDIKSGKPYFCYIKKVNGENHMLSNINDLKALSFITKEFLRIMKCCMKENLDKRK